MMKRVFLLFVSLALAGSLSAQKLTLHPRLEAAGSLCNVDNRQETKRVFSKPVFGGRAGAMLELNFDYGSDGSYYIAPGLIWKTAGSTGMTKELGEELGLKDYKGTQQWEYYQYISIPLNVGIRFPIAPLMASIEIGPYLAYALSVITKYADDAPIPPGKTQPPIKANTWYDLIKLDRNFRRWDIGLGTSVALEYNRFQLRLGADFGFYDFSAREDINVKHNQYYLGIGYRF